MALPMRPSPTIPTRPSTARLTRSVVADCPSATGAAPVAERDGVALLSFLSIWLSLEAGQRRGFKQVEHHETYAPGSKCSSPLAPICPSLRGLRPAQISWSSLLGAEFLDRHYGKEVGRLYRLHAVPSDDPDNKHLNDFKREVLSSGGRKRRASHVSHRDHAARSRIVLFGVDGADRTRSITIMERGETLCLLLGVAQQPCSDLNVVSVGRGVEQQYQPQSQPCKARCACHGSLHV